MPTMSRPRFAIAAIVEPAGMCRGAGAGPAGRRLARGSQAGGGTALGRTAGSTTPSGFGTDPDADGDAPRGSPVAEPQPATSATDSTTAATRLIGTPRSVVGARPPRRPRARQSAGPAR